MKKEPMLMREYPQSEAQTAAKREEPIPLVDLKAQWRQVGEEIEARVLEVLRSQIVVLGPEVEALEREVAEYCGAAHAIGVSSGTDALLMVMMALGIGSGDEVITTDYSFFATAGSIARTGARPVFVDIERTSYNIDPARIEAAITPRTRAILPVHLYGRVAAMDAIGEIAAARGIPVIEDAAQAIGAEFQGRRAGSLATAACFSFYPTKNLAAVGDAGMVTTQDPELARKLKILRVHGAERQYRHKTIGGNFRMDAIQAAALRVKLGYLEEWTRRRIAHAEVYRSLLREAGFLDTIVTAPESGDGRHVYHQYIIAARRRDALMDDLTAQGIGCAKFYPLALHRQECFTSIIDASDRFPQSDWAAAHTLALPIYPELTHEQIQRVVQTIAKFYAGQD